MPLASSFRLHELAHERVLVRDALVAMVTHLVGHPLRTLEFLAKMRGA